ncbi:MAG TPA: hypothetical protein VGX69_06880 [Solirubrobacteraceae bacterium]|jgi:hypothetical protein|nr:hypothetical protein [Solirubrobacteraceae bacterium]
MHRTVILIVVGVLVGLACATPALARSTTLLSGYGGPGQGNQAVLGATMLGGRGGGSSAGGSGSSASGSSAHDGSESPSLVVGRERPATRSSSTPPLSSPTPPRGSTRVHGSPGRSSGRSSGATREDGPRAPLPPPSAYPISEHIPSGAHADALGLSAADLIYIILGAGIVLGVGLFVRRAAAAGSQRSTSS